MPIYLFIFQQHGLLLWNQSRFYDLMLIKECFLIKKNYIYFFFCHNILFGQMPAIFNLKIMKNIFEIKFSAKFYKQILKHKLNDNNKFKNIHYYYYMQIITSVIAKTE